MWLGLLLHLKQNISLLNGTITGHLPGQKFKQTLSVYKTMATTMLGQLWSHPVWFHSLRGNNKWWDLLWNSQETMAQNSKLLAQTDVQRSCFAAWRLSTQDAHESFLMGLSRKFLSIHYIVPTLLQVTFIFLQRWKDGRWFLGGIHLKVMARSRQILERLNRLAAKFYEEDVQTLVSRYDKCSDLSGDYVKK